MFLSQIMAESLTTGDGLVHQLFVVLLVGICCALIWWAGNWFMGKAGGPPLAGTVWNGLFILILLIVVINFLLSLAGHGFVKL